MVKMRAKNYEWYFAYGSNLNRDIFCGRRRIQPRDTKKCYLSEFSLAFNLPVGSANRGVANLTYNPQKITWGVAYEISAAAGQRLDRSEGTHRGFYRRQSIIVTLDNKRELTAFTYMSTRHQSNRLPSARYLGLIVNGARYHGLPDTWINHLARWKLATDERISHQTELF